jgi:hypothetical protein
VDVYVSCIVIYSYLRIVDSKIVFMQGKGHFVHNTYFLCGRRMLT